MFGALVPLWSCATAWCLARNSRYFANAAHAHTCVHPVIYLCALKQLKWNREMELIAELCAGVHEGLFHPLPRFVATPEASHPNVVFVHIRQYHRILKRRRARAAGMRYDIVLSVYLYLAKCTTQASTMTTEVRKMSTIKPDKRAHLAASCRILHTHPSDIHSHAHTHTHNTCRRLLF